MDLGRSISNFGNSIYRSAAMVGDANYRAQKQKSFIEKSLALTTLKQNNLDKIQYYRANWDKKDEDGKPMYQKYLEDYDSFQKEQWEEISKMFTNPNAADEFFPVFNEFMSASRMDLDEMVTKYEAQENKITAVETLNKLSTMAGDSYEDREANIRSFVTRGVEEEGIFTAQEGREYLETALKQSSVFEVDRIAGKTLDKYGFDAARAYIQGSPLIGDEDKKNILSKYENEHKYQEKLKEEIHNKRREEQRKAFSESINTGELRNVDRLYDLAKVTGVDLESGDLNSMAALIRQLNREDEAKAKGKELESNKIVLNHIATMMNDRSNRREDIIKYLNDALEAGDNNEEGGILAKDYNALMKKLDTPEFRHLNDSATKQVIAEIETAAKGKEPLITEAEKEQLIDDYYNWMTHNKWSEERFLDDTEYSDADKLQWLENRLNPIKAGRISSAIRTLADSFFTSDNEELQLNLEEGKGIGIFNSDLIAKELSVPEFTDSEKLRKDLSLNIYSKPFERLNKRQQEIIKTNEKLVSLIKAQRNDLVDYAGIKDTRVRINDKGVPIFEDMSTGDYYRVKIENKNESWEKWIWIDKENGKGAWEKFVPAGGK